MAFKHVTQFVRGMDAAMLQEHDGSISAEDEIAMAAQSLLHAISQPNVKSPDLSRCYRDGIVHWRVVCQLRRMAVAFYSACERASAVNNGLMSVRLFAHIIDLNETEIQRCVEMSDESESV